MEVLQQIDRRAWAVSRPNKPAELDEASWEARGRAEIAAIDPSLTRPRAPISVAATDLNALDLDLLAAQAVVDADERSASSGGRFSVFDVRAGAIRALSRTGVVAERDRQVAGALGMCPETLQLRPGITTDAAAEIERPWR